jgi:GNAT superfamily N-acetyltransferase
MATVTGRHSIHWPAFLRLYHEAFPDGEREPDELVATRTESGRYRLRVSLAGDAAVTGCYVVDVVPEEDYALLCYVAVQRQWRKAGVGRRLCLDAVEWFRHAMPVRLLLVEAKPRAARLYRRCGFAGLELDYRVPYVGAPGVQPMRLLALTGPRGPEWLERSRLARIIRHLYVDGYQVPADDHRLREQLSRVPTQTRIEHAPVQATG